MKVYCWPRCKLPCSYSVGTQRDKRSPVTTQSSAVWFCYLEQRCCRCYKLNRRGGVRGSFTLAAADLNRRLCAARSLSNSDGQPAAELRRVTASYEHLPSQSQRDPICYVVAGVSGSGKSTIGALLAQGLDCNFFDGDDFHPEANIAKMRSGQPLTDQDRLPWLQILAELLQEHVAQNQLCVLACSALRRSYRDILVGHAMGLDNTDHIAFVLLQPDKEELLRRTKAREAQGGHFMPAALLESQLAALEPDASAMVFHMLQPKEIVESVIDRRGKPGNLGPALAQGP